MQKVTQENNASVPNNGSNYTANITSTTNYISGFVYESKAYSNASLASLQYTDVLQFTSHEEGRIRRKTDGSFAYDYFLKDHLGNVRMVLTEEQKKDMYPAATMETAAAATEELIYANLPQTRTDKSTVAGYPVDNTTSPNDKVAKVSAATGSQKVGPSITLKVMAGDKFNIKVSSWYKTNGTSPGTPVSPLADLLTALINGVSGASGGKVATAQLQSSGVLTPGATQFLNNQTPDASRPKAYLNWILFDEQFKFVSSSSGAEQVPVETAFGTAPNQIVYPHVKSNLTIDKSGYLYIYVSNETPNIDVFFDNLQVTHIRGPILEETHYYPFGLTMAGISSKAAGTIQNKEKTFQGQRFDDDLGLNWVQFKWRNHDPQIGRFIEIDPLASKYVYNSTYAFSENKVIAHVELEGLESEYYIINQAKKELAGIFQYGADMLGHFSFSSGITVENGNQSNGVNLNIKSNSGETMRSIIKNNSNESAPPVVKVEVKTEATKTLAKTEIKTPAGSVSASKTQNQDGTTTSQASAEVKTPNGVNVGGTVSRNSNGDVTTGATVSASDGSTTVTGEASRTTNTSNGTSSFEVKVKLEQKIDNTKINFSNSIRYDK